MSSARLIIIISMRVMILVVVPGAPAFGALVERRWLNVDVNDIFFGYRSTTFWLTLSQNLFQILLRTFRPLECNLVQNLLQGYPVEITTRVGNPQCLLTGLLSVLLTLYNPQVSTLHFKSTAAAVVLG
jgi:hypothetical protein